MTTQPRESRDDYFRLASVSMAPQNVFFDRCMTAVEHYIFHCKSERCHFIPKSSNELPLAYARFELKALLVRKLCIGITFCEAIQAGCWLERTAGYATQRGKLSITCFCVALCLLPRRNVGNRIMVFSTALWQKCWIP